MSISHAFGVSPLVVLTEAFQAAGDPMVGTHRQFVYTITLTFPAKH